MKINTENIYSVNILNQCKFLFVNNCIYSYSVPSLQIMYSNILKQNSKAKLLDVLKVYIYIFLKFTSLIVNKRVDL